MTRTLAFTDPVTFDAVARTAAIAVAIYKEDPSPANHEAANTALDAWEQAQFGTTLSTLAATGAALIAAEKAEQALAAERERQRARLVRERDAALKSAEKEDEAYLTADEARE